MDVHTVDARGCDRARPPFQACGLDVEGQHCLLDAPGCQGRLAVGDVEAEDARAEVVLDLQGLPGVDGGQVG